MDQRLAGYVTDAGFDPAEDRIGPFYYRQAEDGWQYAFVAETHHCNTFGTVHGGVLMTFADFCLCLEATDHYSGFACATVSLNVDFMASGKVGDFIEGRTEIVRRTRSLAFVRGEVSVADQVICTYSSVVRIYPDE